jgi:alpha-tubulin suppressor-like RCC1 family protein
MISLGSATAFALRRDGSVWWWGFSYVDQTRSTIPTRVPIDRVVSIGSGGMHACGLIDDGTIACWGDGQHGVLGDGFQRDHADPVAVRWTLPPVVPSGLLAGRHVVSLALDAIRTCAILDDASVACWGSNSNVIDGTRADDSFDRPTQVPALTGVRELVLDDVRARAVHADGHVTGWGDANAAVHLDHVDHFVASGSLVCTQRHDRVDCVDRGSTSSIAGVVQLAAARDYADPCVLLANRTVSCLHDGAFVVQPGFSDVVQIALAYGDGGICARRGDGEVQCTDIRGRSPDPPVAGLTDAIDVVAGIWATCVRTRSGAVWCWGWGRWALGSEPHEIPWLRGAREVALGDNHWCARMDGDRVLCWGDNSDGQLGDGTMDDSFDRPTEVVW